MALVNPNIALAVQPMQTPNLLGMQQTAAQTQNQLARTDIMKDQARMEKETFNYDTALSRSKGALRFINTPEQYLAWTESNFKDPLLGPLLQNMGVDPQTALASAAEMLRQPGGLQSAIGKSASSISQLAQTMTAQGGQARTQARADAKAAQTEREREAQMAQVQSIMGGAGMGSGTGGAGTRASAAPAAQAFPVANALAPAGAAPAVGRAPVNQLAARPGSAEAQMRETYGMPPINVTGQPVPAAGAPVPRETPAAAPAAPAGSDPRMAQLAQLDALALQGNDLAAQQAKTMRNAMEFEKKMRPDEPNVPTNVQEYEYAVNQGYTGDFVEFQENKRDPKFEAEYSKQVGKQKAEADTELVKSAEAAAQALPKIYGTLDLIENSDAITGIGAEILTGLERLRSQFMGDVRAGRRVADTETLNAYLGSEVFPLISALGIGARGLDTPAEREFLRQVMTGTISLNRDTLSRLTELRRDGALSAINKYNTALDKGRLDPYYRTIGLEPNKIDVPQRGGAGGGRAQSAPVSINSDAEYDALPSGATFVAPDGTTRRKP